MRLSEFVTRMAIEHRRLGRHRTAETYLCTLRSMLSFQGDNIRLRVCFTSEWLFAYQNHLISLGLTHNTIVFYISRIRSVYNKAVKAKLVKLQDELFDHLYTRSVSTAKRALSHETISLISEGDLSEHANLEFARDMFMLSFYLQGISFVDLAHLRKTDVYS